MAGIWLGRGCQFAPHRVEIPDQAWIAPPGKRGSDFFDSIIAPESAGIAKRRNTAFGADAGTGENKNAIGGRDGELWHWRYQKDFSWTFSQDAISPVIQTARHLVILRRSDEVRCQDSGGVHRTPKTGDRRRISNWNHAQCHD